MKKCPCGSGKEYKECCGLYLETPAKAPTAEALMRSRYTAYVEGKTDYIIETHDPENRDNVSPEETEKWSRESQWKGLKIHATSAGKENDTKGMVEFSARFVQNGKNEEHHERSQFKKIDGAWYYIQGHFVTDTFEREQPKVGRNDPCPCGSGKKYKKCCMLKGTP